MTEDLVLNTAAQWHAHVTADTVDWVAFALWLEADPRHARAYDAVALTEILLDEHASALGGPTPANDDEAPFSPRALAPYRRWFAVGAASLAALAAALLLVILPSRPGPQVWQTADRPQDLAMNDGTRVALAPHSALTRDGDHLALTGGAVFSVPHRPGRTLTITSGELTISDIGTHFDLRNDAGSVRLSIDEGQVRVSGAGMAHSMTLASGQALYFDPGLSQIVIAPARDGATGDWQHEQLTYGDTPLPLVAADIARYGRGPLRIDRAIEHLHFSGTLRLGTGHDPAQDLARLMALDLGVSDDGVVLRAARQGRGAGRTTLRSKD